MRRTSGFIVSAQPLIAAIALLCSMIVLGQDSAWAQTASNVQCNKCVDKKDIAKKAVTKNRIKKGAVNESRLSTSLQDHINERESFYITLDGNGATATIATHGPLTYFVRCLLNQPDGGGGFEDRIEIISTSSVAGWFEEDESDNSGGGNLPLNAGQEIISQDEDVDPPGSAYYDELTETSIVAPDGSFLSLEGDAGGLGMNIFGHSCLVAGFIYRLTGSP